MAIRRQDVMMLNEAIGGLGDALLRRAMLQQQQDEAQRQRDLQKAMADQQAAQQKAELAARVEQFNRQFGRQTGRDAVEDTRYGAETAYRQRRDTLGDMRYETERADRQVRDAKADEKDIRDFGQRVLDAKDARMLQEMALGLQAAGLARRDDVTITSAPDEAGNVARFSVPRGQYPIAGTLGTLGVAGGAPGTDPRRQALLDAVRTGKMTKDQAKALAKQWNLQ